LRPLLCKQVVTAAEVGAGNRASAGVT